MSQLLMAVLIATGMSVAVYFLNRWFPLSKDKADQWRITKVFIAVIWVGTFIAQYFEDIENVLGGSYKQ